MPDVLTEVTATVDDARAGEVLGAFRGVLAGAIPDRLLRTELLRGRNGEWCVQLLWRDQDALGRMRASGEPSAAS